MKPNIHYIDEIKLDPEEQEIEKAFETGKMHPVPDLAEEKRKLKEAARYTLQKNRNVNLRLSAATIYRIQILALEEGVPYQTYMASILHKHAMKDHN